MALPLRVCIFDPTDSEIRDFAARFAEVPGIQILSTCRQWRALQEVLATGRADAVIANLDRQFGPDLLIIQQIAEMAPDCRILAISRDNDPATIIAAMRAGCGQFARWPVDPADLEQALQRLRRGAPASDFRSKRICVMSASGGAGSTTIACNLAMELAQLTQRRIALVDLDVYFGDVACSFDLKTKYSLADVCGSLDQVDRTMVNTAVEDLPCNVCILARPARIEQAETIRPEGIEAVLQVMGQMYPFIVVDLPRNLSASAAVALATTDELLIVSQINVPHLRNATRLYEHVLRQGADPDHIHFVLNRDCAEFGLIKPADMERHLGRPVFARIPNDYKRLGAARDLGHPIMTDAPESPARQAIRQMAKRLLGEEYAELLGEDEGGGLLRFFRRSKTRAAAE